jgi:hypothetical protein
MATLEQRSEFQELGSQFRIPDISIGSNGRIISNQNLDEIRREKPKDTGHRRNPNQGKNRR